MVGKDGSLKVAFDQDEGSGESDEKPEVCDNHFAAQGDAFEAYDVSKYVQSLSK